MSQTPLSDAYLASRLNGQNEQSWYEFAKWLELKMAYWKKHARTARVKRKSK